MDVECTGSLYFLHEAIDRRILRESESYTAYYAIIQNVAKIELISFVNSFENSLDCLWLIQQFVQYLRYSRFVHWKKAKTSVVANWLMRFNSKSESEYLN